MAIEIGGKVLMIILIIAKTVATVSNRRWRLIGYCSQL